MSKLFRIPQPYEDSFQDFFNLSNETRNKLIKLLRESSLEISNRKNISKISTELNIPYSVLYNIDRMIFSLFSLIDENQMSIDGIVDGIFEAIKEKDKFTFNNGDLSILKEQFNQILSLNNEPYGLSAKAMELSNDYENLFIDGRVITDIRPIFNKDSIDSPVSMMVLHNFKIDFQSNNQENEFYITIDSTDIDKLIQILERAKQKEFSIRKYLNEKEISNLEFYKE